MAGFPPGNVTDSSLDTAWRSDRIPAWIYVDFGSVANVNRAVLNWRTGEHASRYALYAWMGGAWRGVYATSTGDGGLDSATFSPIQTRHLLLYGTAAPGLVLGLNEFEVYGSLTGGVYPLDADPASVPEEVMWSAHPDTEVDRPDVLPSLDAVEEGLEGLGGTSVDGALAPVDGEVADAAGFPNPEESAR
jgi:hypothetical protein